MNKFVKCIDNISARSLTVGEVYQVMDESVQFYILEKYPEEIFGKGRFVEVSAPKLVKCIRADDCCLIAGSIYEVEKEIPANSQNPQSYYKVKGNTQHWYQNRFEEVEEPKKEKMMDKFVRCIDNKGLPLIKGLDYKVVQEHTDSYQLLGYSSQLFAKSLFENATVGEPAVKTVKFVKCIDANGCGHRLEQGKIYQVVEETTTVDGQLSYTVKGDHGIWWQSRFEEVPAPKETKFVKCIRDDYSSLVVGNLYEVEEEIFPSEGIDDPAYYKLKGHSQRWYQDRFEEVPKETKLVTCIRDAASTGLLKAGQIYEVETKLPDANGGPRYILKGVSQDWWQDRFEPYPKPEAPTTNTLSEVCSDVHLDAMKPTKSTKTKRYYHTRAKLHARLNDLITHLHEATLIGNDKTLNQHEEELDTVARYMIVLRDDILVENKE